ncbi:MAG TPA: siphovirus Gp157 family protein [Alloacidobacterium sp.]|nr:siphovirus Gp157 family protein [Alloacidobacterium sp.]
MSQAPTLSLFEIDAELNDLSEAIQEACEQGSAIPDELQERFNQFCAMRDDKTDRIGRFIRMMEAREQFCRGEANRLTERARDAAGKVERTKNMVLYYLLSRNLQKIEGQQFTLRAQKNSQDSVKITDQAAIPRCYCRIEARIAGVIWETMLSLLPDELAKTLESSVLETRPDNDAIKAAVAQNAIVPGADVRRGTHLRVA